MDLLQRLIAGSGSASSKPQRLPNSTERLTACKRLCNALQSTWRSSSSLAEDDTASSHVAGILRRLNTILEEESRKAAPHSCLHYTASNQIYIIVAKLALASTSREVISATTSFLHFLINGEVEGIIDSKIFARSVIDVVRRSTAPAAKVVDERGETALIELLFEVCTKIRLDPNILPAWFYPERTPSQKAVSHNDARRSQFPLFYVLLDYVHWDGTVGDFARTALLYLTETAVKSRPLEKWMMESDLAHQLASGLSALYARLTRHTPQISKQAMPILSFSDGFDGNQSLEAVDEDSRLDMRAFLSYTAFWQDTMSHCKSTEVRDTLLDSFQLLFVEQLLYPSLLESSDVEGGSTAAVMLHLCQLLEALDQPQIIGRLLDYLFAAKSQPVVPKAQKRMSMSRRISMEQLATLAQTAGNPSPDLFSLLDLIVFSLRSSHFRTVISSLKLITVLVRRHHPYIREQLLSLEELQPGSRQNLNSLNDTMLTMFDYAGSISQVNSMDHSYQAALRDSQSMMEHHSCLFDDSARSQHQPGKAVSGRCKVFSQMLTLLESWFANNTLVNLELTGAFSSLAACEHILMRTWLSPASPTGLSVISVINQLIQQIKRWRSQFVEWDAFFSIQKVELASEDELCSSEHRPETSFDSRSVVSEQTRLGTPPPSPQVVAAKLADLEIGSIDGRIASDGGAASDTGSVRHHFAGSPQMHDALEGMSSRSISSGTLSATLLETRIPVVSPTGREASSNKESHLKVAHDKDQGPDELNTVDAQNDRDTDPQYTASLRHVLTQAIILQEFILELAAALQIRATLFDEVDLS